MKYVLLLVLALNSPTLYAWEKNCDSGQCRIYTFTDISHELGEEPVRLFLEISESNNVILTALNTRTYHNVFYTTNPPTYMSFDQKDYVGTRTYFYQPRENTITVDGRMVALFPPLNESQLISQNIDFDTIMQSFKHGDSVSIEYGSLIYGGGQEVSFSLAGFTKSYNSLFSEITTSGQQENEQIDPISLLSPILDGNSYSITPGDLVVEENPLGLGAFVYAPQTNYSGIERLFIWFVHRGVAIKLNGATHNLTSSLNFPSDTSLGFWEGTDLSATTVTQAAIELAFDF